MFKYIAFFFALVAVAFAAPRPGYVAPYVAAPIAYSAGYVAPAAYSTHYAAPVAAAYSAPVYGSAYSAYSAYPSYAYAY